MVNIKSIKTKRCPICGCEYVVKEELEVNEFKSVPNVHTNGHQFEQRYFACGYGVEFSPNFLKEKVIHTCRNDRSIDEENSRKKELVNRLVEEIENSNCNDVNKKSLISAVRYKLY